MTMHATHPDVIKRLKRAEGHLRSTIVMLEQGRACADIAQQLQAVESAVSKAKKTLVHDHIDHCLEQQVRSDSSSAKNALKEFKEISKYL